MKVNCGVVEFQSLRVGTKLIVDRYRRNSV